MATSQSKIVGYMRLKNDIAPDLRKTYHARLTKAGATTIIDEPVAGVRQRPMFDSMVAGLTKGDTVVIVRESHLSANITIASECMDAIAKAGAALNVLMPMATNGPGAAPKEGDGGGNGGP